MNVRAKFKVDSKKENLYTAGQKRVTIEMNPVYSNEEGSENKKFWDATPSGKIELGTVNQAAGDAFELGKEYYVDFTPAE